MGTDNPSDPEEFQRSGQWTARPHAWSVVLAALTGLGTILAAIQLGKGAGWW